MLNALRQKPVSGSAPNALIVLLHGIGADGQDLIGLAGPLGEVLPHAMFIAPEAPFPTDSGFGRQWFVRDTWRADQSIPAVRATEATRILNGFLDAELADAGLAGDRLGLFGFSQGAMMALNAGLLRQPTPAAIVACSGALPDAGTFEKTQHNNAPVLLVHGEADKVVPIARLVEAENALRKAGVPVTSLRRPLLGHSIDDAEITATAQFFAKYL